jgi:hypothetical protein
VDEKGRVGTPVRVDHGGRGLRDYLEALEKGTPVAVEASGGWYWFMDELEKAGLDARLVNPLEANTAWAAKITDKLDAKGLAILLRSGTLPEVWIPPAGLRDLRGLMRTRLATQSHARTTNRSGASPSFSKIPEGIARMRTVFFQTHTFLSKIRVKHRNPAGKDPPFRSLGRRSSPEQHQQATELHADDERRDP